MWARDRRKYVELIESYVESYGRFTQVDHDC